jgi:hypothetical protein
MVYNYNDIMLHQSQRLAAQKAQSLAELEAARISGDVAMINRASDDLLRVDSDIERLDKIAARHFAPPAEPGDNTSQKDRGLMMRYGLNAGELDVARGWTADPNLSDDERISQYLENKQRYQLMRASGAYRDDQGQVRR